MKKMPTLLFAVTMLAGFSSVAMGQSTSDDGTITAEAEVVDAISVTGITNLNFGNVVAGSLTYIEPESGYVGDLNSVELMGPATGGEERGIFKIDAGSNEVTNVQISFPDQLKNSDESEVLDTDWSFTSDGATVFVTDGAPTDGTFSGDPGSIVGGQQQYWTLVSSTPGDEVVYENSDLSIPEGTNVVHAVIGGREDVAVDQPIDSYSGSIELNVSIPN
ncbi:hypothetical protein [Gracilimonas halophila]|uniref:DUF4402 domain-containing protein n=1 Tax=Gracilimonas halophila TaxID=1834464 RepID=A0ABW5JN51_9BACT